MWGRDNNNLAIDYGYEHWEEQPVKQERSREKTVVEQPRSNVRTTICHICFVVAFVFGAAYAAVVLRSTALAESNRQLSAMRVVETNLIHKNNELRIEVEQLRGPDRIIGFAESKLGMSVARSNIYLKAGTTQNTSTTMAVANK